MNQSTLIYLASPYTHDRECIQELRYLQTMRAVNALQQNKIYVYSPILYLHCLAKKFNHKGDCKTWEDFDNIFLSKADEFLIYKGDGWVKSRGIKKELVSWVSNNTNKRARCIDDSDVIRLEGNYHSKYVDLPLFE